MKPHIALISFLTASINTRLLSSHIKSRGFNATCIYCPAAIDDKVLESLASVLSDTGITIAGISLVTDNYQQAVLLTRFIKQRFDIPVIWGGAHVNVMPEESLRHADMVCLGEGEEALADVMRSLEKNGSVGDTISNIWIRTPSGIKRNSLRALVGDMDSYPFPDQDFSTQFVITDTGVRPLRPEDFNGEYSTMTSRGCPYNCHYCYNNYRRKQYEGRGVYLRRRSIDNVMAELEAAKRLIPGLKRINFWDDSFVARPLEEFGRFSAEYSSKIGLPFFALIEPMAFNIDKITALASCGLSLLQVGVQSGSDRLNRSVYNRAVSSSQVVAMGKALNGLGIRTVYDVIFNNPYETIDDIRATIALFCLFPRPLILQGYNLIFYPGTEITARALKDGYITENAEAERFETIQGSDNSPTAVKGGGVVSSRFYTICYDSSPKDYWNRVLILLCYNFVPLALIRYFARSKTAFKVVALALLAGTYDALSALRRKIV